MPLDEKILGQVFVTSTSIVTLYSAVSSRRPIIKTMRVCNNLSSTANFSIFMTSNSATAALGNAQFNHASINAFTTVDITSFQALALSAGHVYVACDPASACTFTLFGVETTT